MQTGNQNGLRDRDAVLSLRLQLSIVAMPIGALRNQGCGPWGPVGLTVVIVRGSVRASRSDFTNSETVPR